MASYYVRRRPQLPRWRNYVAQYTSVNKEELAQKMREAMAKLQLQPPLAAGDQTKTAASKAA